MVSAAFILISSKVGDLIGRKRAYVLGLLGYAVGATAMVLAQELRAVIIFWASSADSGSLLLPAMQSLIHGNFEGATQRRVYALVGAAAAIAAAVGPLVGGFITTFLSGGSGSRWSWLSSGSCSRTSDDPRGALHRGEGHRPCGAAFSVLGMGGIVLGILVWQEGGEAVGALMVIGAISLGLLAWWLRPAQAGRAGAAAGPGPVQSKIFRLGITGQGLQQISLGGAMIALPIFLQMVLEFNALQDGPVPRPAVAHDVRGRPARRSPSW